jgi:hypothetical protein
MVAALSGAVIWLNPITLMAGPPGGTQCDPTLHSMLGFGRGRNTTLH